MLYKFFVLVCLDSYFRFSTILGLQSNENEAKVKKDVTENVEISLVVILPLKIHTTVQYNMISSFQ